MYGATVTERLACSPPTKAILGQSPAGSLRIFACGNRAGRCRWSAGLLGDLQFPPPFHSGATPYSPQSPSSTLKTSMLRTVQISSLTHSLTHSNKCKYSGYIHGKYEESAVHCARSPYRPCASRTLEGGVENQLGNNPTYVRQTTKHKYSCWTRAHPHYTAHSQTLRHLSACVEPIKKTCSEMPLTRGVASPGRSLPTSGDVLAASHGGASVDSELKSMRVKQGECGVAPECKGWETGDPRENPPTSGIVRHDSQVRKSGERPRLPITVKRTPGWQHSEITRQLTASYTSCPVATMTAVAPQLHNHRETKIKSSDSHSAPLPSTTVYIYCCRDYDWASTATCRLYYYYEGVAYSMSRSRLLFLLRPAYILRLRAGELHIYRLFTANRVRIPARSLSDFRAWKSFRMMALVSRFSLGFPVSPALAFRRCSITCFALVGSLGSFIKRCLHLSSRLSTRPGIERRGLGVSHTKRVWLLLSPAGLNDADRPVVSPGQFINTTRINNKRWWCERVLLRLHHQLRSANRKKCGQRQPTKETGSTRAALQKHKLSGKKPPTDIEGRTSADNHNPDHVKQSVLVTWITLTAAETIVSWLQSGRRKLRVDSAFLVPETRTLEAAQVAHSHNAGLLEAAVNGHAQVADADLEYTQRLRQLPQATCKTPRPLSTTSATVFSFMKAVHDYFLHLCYICRHLQQGRGGAMKAARNRAA
ncbi:hypothetical protein PR048_009224 [Dryococelus australis]|uniref:Uncharacterized protein n=1 Tax=Dryococelus australis TaxID=614101 RepID=A0ABQ9HZ89_9NEOP|nr:hypothetical protein PR048_009224 [Dryococelus australis]